MTQPDVNRRLQIARRTFMTGAAASALTLTAATAWATTENGYAEGDIAIGSEDAPVTVIEYASMTCPHCATFHNNTLKGLVEKYVDTGQVRMIFREFPFDQLGLAAAMLARCAGPDRAVGMIDVLFRQQSSWSRSNDPIAELRKIGRLGGISKSRFDACLGDQKLAESIVATRMEGQEKYDVNSTPSFIINGDKYSGAMSLAEFDRVLEKYLN